MKTFWCDKHMVLYCETEKCMRCKTEVVDKPTDVQQNTVLSEPDPSYVRGQYVVGTPFVNNVRGTFIPIGAPSAPELLRRAAGIIEERAAKRDQDGERSMAKTVAAFNDLTGNKLSVTDGWVFMAIVKLARSQHGLDLDNFVDGAAFIALAGESAVPTTKGD